MCVSLALARIVSVMVGRVMEAFGDAFKRQGRLFSL